MKENKYLWLLLWFNLSIINLPFSFQTLKNQLSWGHSEWSCLAFWSPRVRPLSTCFVFDSHAIRCYISKFYAIRGIIKLCLSLTDEKVVKYYSYQFNSNALLSLFAALSTPSKGKTCVSERYFLICHIYVVSFSLMFVCFFALSTIKTSWWGILHLIPRRGFPHPTTLQKCGGHVS